MSVSDALAQIITLCGGQFYDDGRPKSEVEYRRNFIFATTGLSDEQIASLWAKNLVYESPAHDWYEQLISTTSGEAKAKKWSTLEPEIETRWPTPPRDLRAAKQRHRTRWREHKFDIQPMLDALANDSASVKPHQAWAQQHKALGAALSGTSDEDKVAQTLDILPVCVLELLPKCDSYVDEWDDLIKDIGNISSRLLLSRYNQHAMFESMYSLSLSQSTQPDPPRTNPGWRAVRRDRSPPPVTPVTSSQRRGSSLRFNNSPQIIPAAAQPAPIPPARPQMLATPSRDPPPHSSFAPQTPGPIPNVLSRIQALAEQPPSGALRVPDTPSDKARWTTEVTQWKAQYSKQPPSLRRPFPFRPGTFEQTADSCTRCGMGDHYAYACEAEGPDVLDDKEQGYRRVLARKLRDDRKAGAQPSTPSPQQRFRDTAQVEFEEAAFDPESDLDSGNE
ncbi:Retrovirus-related Pol polyprotein from transposon [Ceratobasidium sp. AG-Ba]|nr:Retrovirus-related Pol polyprotein from transposon [Ceratobasidium sp. AG-Ba]